MLPVGEEAAAEQAADGNAENAGEMFVTTSVDRFISMDIYL